jgi:hypothetical protein
VVVGVFSKSTLILTLIYAWEEPVNFASMYFYLRIAQGKAINFITHKLINHDISSFLSVKEYVNRQNKIVGLM